MCEKRKHNRIDKCMKGLIHRLNILGVKTLACCCGHDKYPMTIVCQRDNLIPVELFSGKIINRAKRFYIKDKEGYYFIPEIVKSGRS